MGSILGPVRRAENWCRAGLGQRQRADLKISNNILSVLMYFVKEKLSFKENYTFFQSQTLKMTTTVC